jgi:hypothetical protein
MYDRRQLSIGTRIEMEHVDPRWTQEHKKRFAEKIARQHLAEFKSYYMVLPGAEKRMAAIDKSMQKRR